MMMMMIQISLRLPHLFSFFRFLYRRPIIRMRCLYDEIKFYKFNVSNKICLVNILTNKVNHHW